VTRRKEVLIPSNKKPTLLALPLSLAVLLLVGATVSCSSDAPAPPPPPPTGARVLSISASLKQPTAPGDLVAAIDMVYNAGARGQFISYTWKNLEPSAGNFALNDLSNGIDYLGRTRGMRLLIGIQVINTTGKEIPTDLAGTAFDSPVMLNRFHALLDAIFPRLNGQVLYLSIGNEVDVYLANHRAEWPAYKAFYNDALAYVHAHQPSIKVGVTATFSGASGSTRTQVADLNSGSDIWILTYYPLGPAFVPFDPAVALTDIPAMVAMTGGRPLVLQEVGYPTSATLSSNEAQQARFVNNVYTAWSANSAAIPFLNYFALHDFSPAQCDQWGAYYGLPNDVNFKAYLCSLGLRQLDGTPKQGWQAFVDGARATGLP